MQLFEWGIASNEAGQPGMCPVGVTDAAPRARSRMLAALTAVPAGVLVRGWVVALALDPDRLTYDRLDTLARITRDADGTVRWIVGENVADTACADGRADDAAGQRMTVIDGLRLRELRRQRGLSRERLAWAAGLGITTLARLERGTRPACRYKTVASLAEVLGETPQAMAAAG